MYKSVKTYLDAVKAADEEKEARDQEIAARFDALVAAEDNYDKRAVIEEKRRADRSASTKLRAAQEAMAWAALCFAPEESVAWIARNCDGYKDHARIVLRALKSTSTAAQMRALARRSSWCGTFDELLLSAKRAGVFADEMSAERLEFLKWFQNNWSGSNSYVTQLEQHIEAVLQAETAALVAKARAEASGERAEGEVALLDEPVEALAG
jgi:hypothetical protein